MKEKLLQFIEWNQLISGKNPVLLAVSGGIDSVVMAHLFSSCNIPFAIAHCNFQLRDNDSHQDEEFVKNLATKLKVKFHFIRFDAKSYAEKNHLSIQLAARELRYAWFHELIENYNYQSVATAHHFDDQAESFFINLLRGTGIKGLHGIPMKNDKLIRPLLEFTKHEIESFAVKNKIPYRNDSSNDELYYLRNQVRHKLLPVIHEIQPSFEAVLKGNLRRLAQENHILQDYLTPLKDKVLKSKDGLTFINIPALLQIPYKEYLLHILLEPYGFQGKHIESIMESLEKQAGKKFENKNYLLVKDRTNFILYRKSEITSGPIEYSISFQPGTFTFKEINTGYHLKFSEGKITASFKIDPSDAIAQLDLDKVVFPLILRKWKQGDKIYPLGMKGKKKVSDLLIDRKLSLPEKDKIMVLCSGKEIIWIPGIKINDKYKMSENSKKYLKISLLNT